MIDIFIKSISINSVRNLPSRKIDISSIEKKHLILTGKNGSGKTTLLLNIKQFLSGLSDYNYSTYLSAYRRVSNTEAILTTKNDNERLKLESGLGVSKDIVNAFGKTISLEFNTEDIFSQTFKSGDFLLCYFDANRIPEFNIPKGISKIDKQYLRISQRNNSSFIQLLVNLKASRSFANDDHDSETVQLIDSWFKNFINSLSYLLDSSDVKLKFDRTNFTYKILEPNKQPYGFEHLSSGYSAIFDIVSEIMMRMSLDAIIVYDKPGIVLIDEIDTHLHIELQKIILPFLTSLFPNIQFIVTTHSPFVLTSVENSVIYDLEKNTVIEDLSKYSYDAIVEGYFGSDKYSNTLKEMIEIYEKLLFKDELSDDEKDTLKELEEEVNNLPKFLSPELEVKIQSLKLRQKLNKQ